MIPPFVFFFWFLFFSFLLKTKKVGILGPRSGQIWVASYLVAPLFICVFLGGSQTKGTRRPKLQFRVLHGIILIDQQVLSNFLSQIIFFFFNVVLNNILNDVLLLYFIYLKIKVLIYFLCILKKMIRLSILKTTFS